ncbi:MAG: OmpA family protein [Algoriphagus sp.]|nr:OmpA family protein [Algoriphagus sp.]
MKKLNQVILKASGAMLLAFCITATYAQQLKSISGANSPTDDTNPVWIGNNTLFFTRAFHPKNIGGKADPGDIWMTKKDPNGTWTDAIHRPDLSSAGYDLVLGLEDVLTLLVLRIENNSKTIRQYSKFGQDWNYLRTVNFPNLNEFEGLVSGRVAQGGKFIFIAGKKTGGFGNEDIYISEKTGVIDWSSPVNLGNVINGSAQEMGPYFDPEANLLFYSSSSHPGATGKDILIAKKTGESWDSWSKPEKWEQISTKGSETSITFLSKEEVVWTSTQSSDGFADLMTFENPVPLIIPSDYKAPTEQLISSAIKVTPVIQTKPESSVQPISSPAPIQVNPKKESPVTDEPEIPVSWLVMDAKLKIEVPFSLAWQKDNQTANFPVESRISDLEKAGVTSVRIFSKGYFPIVLPLSELMRKGKTVVLVTKAEAGSSVTLKDVNFKVGTAELESDGTQNVLKEIAEFLLNQPNLVVRINGHTDNLGDPTLSKELSLQRAIAVRNYLVANGVNFEKLRISGWGGTKPIASNATEAGRAKNRRVELTVEN